MILNVAVCNGIWDGVYIWRFRSSLNMNNWARAPVTYASRRYIASFWWQSAYLAFRFSDWVLGFCHAGKAYRVTCLISAIKLVPLSLVGYKYSDVIGRQPHGWGYVDVSQVIELQKLQERLDTIRKSDRNTSIGDAPMWISLIIQLGIEVLKGSIYMLFIIHYWSVY